MLLLFSHQCPLSQYVLSADIFTYVVRLMFPAGLVAPVIASFYQATLDSNVILNYDLIIYVILSTNVLSMVTAALLWIIVDKPISDVT